MNTRHRQQQQHREHQQVRWIPVIGPKKWTPQYEGDSIEGRVESIQHRRGPYGNYTQYVISGYDRAWLVQGRSIENLMTAGSIEHGDLVKIVYQGSRTFTDDSGREGKSGRYQLYRGEF